MACSTLRFLVVENEYLIAIDASELLSGIFACEVEIATPAEFTERLAAASWDVVLLNTSGNHADNEYAGRVIAQGAGLVLLSAYLEFERGVPGLEGWPVVMKPFSLQDLATAVCAALDRRGSSRE